MSRKILKIRKLLNTVRTPLNSRVVFKETKILMVEPRMIIKSNMFHPSLKYILGEVPIILINASAKNKAVKM